MEDASWEFLRCFLGMMSVTEGSAGRGVKIFDSRWPRRRAAGRLARDGPIAVFRRQVTLLLTANARNLGSSFVTIDPRKRLTSRSGSTPNGRVRWDEGRLATRQLKEAKSKCFRRSRRPVEDACVATDSESNGGIANSHAHLLKPRNCRRQRQKAARRRLFLGRRLPSTYFTT